MNNSINQAVYRPAWLVKPTHACNFDCKYCYDKDMRRKYGDGIMTMEVWERIVRIASKYNALIVFHGGEPLMVGVDWYREAFEIADKYPPLSYGMQSNLSLLNEEYIELFKERNLTMGGSYDFTAQEDYRGEGTLEKIRLAKEMEFPVSCICVVTKKNIFNLVEIFETASKELISRSLAFNPLFYTRSTKDNNMDLLSVKDLKEGFGCFFTYYRDRLNRDFYEREAETFSGLVKGMGAKSCLYNDCRITWVGVASNGDVYPCDRRYGDEYKYGHITDFNVVTDFLLTSGFSMLYRNTEKRYKNHCSKCDYFCVCNGGCNGRHVEAGSLSRVDSSACNYMHIMYSVAKEVFINDS